MKRIYRTLLIDEYVKCTSWAGINKTAIEGKTPDDALKAIEEGTGIKLTLNHLSTIARAANITLANRCALKGTSKGKSAVHLARHLIILTDWLNTNFAAKIEIPSQIYQILKKDKIQEK